MARIRCLAVALSLAAALPACSKQAQTPPAAATPAATAPVAPAAPSPSGSAGAPIGATASDPRGVVTAVFAALSAGKLDEALRYYAEDHEQSFVVAPQRLVRGKSLLRDLWTRMLTSFPDLRILPRRLFDAGQTWIVQAVLTGTNQGSYGLRPPTGKTVGLEVVYFLTPKNGLIARTVAMTNTAAILRQLGSLAGSHALPSLPKGLEVLKGEGRPANLELLKKAYEALSRGEFAAATALAAPELTVSDHGTDGQTQPWAAYVRGLEARRSNELPDLTITAEETYPVADYVISRSVVRATRKAVPGAPHALRPIVFRLVDVVRVEGNKVRQLETYTDGVPILQQLGAYAPPPAVPVGGGPAGPQGTPGKR